MKKVFLLFGIVAFSAASAQQTDLFNIEKHIEKKKAEGKKKAEKKRLVLPVHKRFTYGNFNAEKNPELFYILPNGDNVVISRINNMPCVKPDMRKFQIMPNLAYSRRFNFNYSPQRIHPGQIPNGSKFYTIIASK